MCLECDIVICKKRRKTIPRCFNKVVAKCIDPETGEVYFACKKHLHIAKKRNFLIYKLIPRILTYSDITEALEKLNIKVSEKKLEKVL